jgi:hypothetical protein
MDKTSRPQAVSLLIGPEGGFTEEEEDMATRQGVIALSMDHEFYAQKLPVWRPSRRSMQHGAECNLKIRAIPASAIFIAIVIAIVIVKRECGYRYSQWHRRYRSCPQERSRSPPSVPTPASRRQIIQQDVQCDRHHFHNSIGRAVFITTPADTLRILGLHRKLFAIFATVSMP